MLQSNSDLHTFYRLRVDEDGYPVKEAPVEEVAVVEDVTFLDDFTIDSYGIIWAATNRHNSLAIIPPGGSQNLIPGGASALSIAGNTATAFGRTLEDGALLYVVTSNPAKVMALDTKQLHLGAS